MLSKGAFPKSVSQLVLNCPLRRYNRDQTCIEECSGDARERVSWFVILFFR